MGLADFKNAIVTEDKFSGTFRKFDSAVGGSAKGVDKLGGLLSGGGLGAVMGGAAGVAGLAVLGKTVWSLGELGAQSLTTKASFESLMRSVGQSPALLDRMTAAAGGTITEMQLMQQANTALAGTSGQLAQEIAAAIPQLIEAGRAAAMLNPSMGDAAFMTQSLITGIKRGSPMLIDNTGITLKLGEATEAYAASVGKSVSELTAQETSIAILRATLAGSDTLIKQVGGSLDSMTGDITSAKVAMEELKVTLGEVFAPTIAAAAEGLAFSLQYLNAVMKDDAAKQMSLELENQIALLAYFNAEVGEGAAFEEARQRKIAATTARIRELQDSMLAADVAAQKLARSLLDDQNASEGARWGMEQAGAGAAGMGSEFDIAAVKARNLRLSMDELRTARQVVTPGLSGDISKAISGNTFTGSYGSAVNTLAGTPMEWDAVNRASLGFANSIASLNTQLDNGKITVGQYQFEVAKLRQGLSDTVSSFNTAGSAAGGYSDKIDDLKSKIGAALRPTFDLSGLTGGALGGMGGDSFDEAYKRLAAVALRPEELQIHQGDWAGTFEQAGLTGLSPEDAQARAKELVEAYSKGLDFSLIDTKAIKDSIRQGIKAEEMYNAMVDEIYAEMGKENPKLKDAGKKTGRQVGEGYVEEVKNVASQTNDIMANAVFGKVLARLRQEDARYQ